METIKSIRKTGLRRIWSVVLIKILADRRVLNSTQNREQPLGLNATRYAGSMCRLENVWNDPGHTPVRIGSLGKLRARHEISASIEG